MTKPEPSPLAGSDSSHHCKAGFVIQNPSPSPGVLWLEAQKCPFSDLLCRPPSRIPSGALTPGAPPQFQPATEKGVTSLSRFSVLLFEKAGNFVSISLQFGTEGRNIDPASMVFCLGHVEFLARVRRLGFYCNPDHASPEPCCARRIVEIGFVQQILIKESQNCSEHSAMLGTITLWPCLGEARPDRLIGPCNLDLAPEDGVHGVVNPVADGLFLLARSPVELQHGERSARACCEGVSVNVVLELEAGQHVVDLLDSSRIEASYDQRVPVPVRLLSPTDPPEDEGAVVDPASRAWRRLRRSSHPFSIFSMRLCCSWARRSTC